MLNTMFLELSKQYKGEETTRITNIILITENKT